MRPDQIASPLNASSSHHAEQTLSTCLAHRAARAVRFRPSSCLWLTGEYNNTIFNAQHGSWDRTPPIGYRVMNIGVDEMGQSTSYSPFAVGWLNATLATGNNNGWGELPDLVASEHCACVRSCMLNSVAAVHLQAAIAPRTASSTCSHLNGPANCHTKHWS